MRIEARDDVGTSVPIKIKSVHLRRGVGEMECVFRPQGPVGEIRWLFPPAFFLDQIELSVSVHITHAKPVREFVIGLVLG